MSAAPVQSNVPADLRQDSQPVYIAERDAIIPRFYQASMHDAHLDAKVSHLGMPVVENGETLTIGMIPHERRWAVGPVEDGWAATIDQKQFDELCILWKQQEVQFKSQGKEVLDFPHLEARPNVRDFVAVKVHRTDPKRLIRLGMPSERQVVRQGTHVYDPDTDQQMTREAWAEREKAKLGGKATEAQSQNARIAELEAKIASLTGGAPVKSVSMMTPAEAAAVVANTAPCGKEVKNLGAHKRFCKKPECQPMLEGDAA